MLLRATLLLFTLLLARHSQAAPLTILAEEWPPFVYLNAVDQPAGMAVDIVQQLQQRTGDTAPMQLKAWDQANALLRSQPDHMMFTLGDTDDNRRDFTQLGPIMVASVTAYSLPRNAAGLAMLPAARLAGEATVAAQDSIAEAAALEAGFRPHRTRDSEQGPAPAAGQPCALMGRGQHRCGPAPALYRHAGAGYRPRHPPSAACRCT